MPPTTKQKPTPEQQQLIEKLIGEGLIDNAKKILQDLNLYDIRFASTKTEEWLNRFITTDIELDKVKNKCRILSNTEDIVLILGETGTGKELLARSLHGDREGKFLALNCAAIPDTLIESELFGAIAGAYTGSIKDRAGIFQASGNGTVFLDEIGELPDMAQAALLRTLQERTIRKVGSMVEEKITCRIVCATWHDLKIEMVAGRFRKDLYYRLSRVVLKTKALRERLEDIPLLIKHFDRESKVTSEDMINKIIENMKQNGSGNVREIENIIRRIELFGEVE